MQLAVREIRRNCDTYRDNTLRHDSRRMIMIPREPKPSSSDEASNEVEKALDEALDETFPASDAVNLHQWTEMHNEELESERQSEAASEESEDELDRTARYLRGPTAFTA
jgi:hypothetical protein